MKTRYGSLTPTEAAKMIMISNLEFEINSFDVGRGAATKYDDRESMQVKIIAQLKKQHNKLARSLGADEIYE